MFIFESFFRCFYINWLVFFEVKMLETRLTNFSINHFEMLVTYFNRLTKTLRSFKNTYILMEICYSGFSPKLVPPPQPK